MDGCSGYSVLSRKNGGISVMGCLKIELPILVILRMQKTVIFLKIQPLVRYILRGRGNVFAVGGCKNIEHYSNNSHSTKILAIRDDVNRKTTNEANRVKLLQIIK